MPYKRIRRTAGLRQRKRARYLNRRRPLAMRRKRALTKKIKSVMLKTTETKYTGAIFNDALTTPILNNFLQVIPINDIENWTSFTTQNPQNYRIGQEYYLARFNVKFCVMNRIQSAGLNIVPMYFRTMIISAKDQQGTVAPSTTQLMWRGVTDLNVSWDAIKDLNQSMWYKIDPKQYTTVYDKKWILGEDGNGQATKNIEFSVPIHKKIKCTAGSEGALLQSKRYFLLWAAFDPRYAGVGTHQLNWQWQAIFKDP